MIFRIELPKTNMAVEAARITAWHKRVGDVIEYGDDLVDIRVEKRTGLRKGRLSKLLAATRHRRARYRTRRVHDLSYRIVALDSGTLVSIDAPEASTVREGSLLATMTSQSDTGTGSDHGDATAVARVVVNRFEQSADSRWN